MKLVVQYRPTDKDLYAGIKIVRFADDTAHQVEPYCEALGAGYCALVVDDIAHDPMTEFAQFTAKKLTDLHNALRNKDEPTVGLPRVRDDATRRLYQRISSLGREVEPVIWNTQPTICNRDEHDAEMIKNADHFVAAAFRGHPKGFDRHEAKTLEAARKIAVELYLDRPIAIYAVRGNRQVHVENFPDGTKTMTDETATDEIKKTKRTPKIGEFAPIRSGTKIAQVVRHLHEEPNATFQSAAELIGTDVDNVTARVKRLRVSNGIDHTVEDGRISLVLPEGKTIDDVFKSTESKPESTDKAPREMKGMAQAREGIMPTPPDFSAETHKGWRKKLAELIALAEAGDVDGLRAYAINPISTSPRALARYRDCAIAALTYKAAA